MHRSQEATNLLILAIVVLVTLLPLCAQQVGNGADKAGIAPPRNQKKLQKSAPLPEDACPAKMPRERFAVDVSGNVSNNGRSYEGPLCVEVFYNPIQQFVGLQTTTTTVNGPDLSKVVLGGTTTQGPMEAEKEVPEVPAKNLPDAFVQLRNDATKLTGNLSEMRQNYDNVIQKGDDVISGIALLRQTVALVSGTDAIDRVKKGYEQLKDTLDTALSSVAVFVPSDRLKASYVHPANALKGILLTDAQEQQNRLNALALDFPDGWSDWLAKNKDQYAALKTILDTNLQTAKDFTSASDNTKALKKKIATAQYWDTLFSTLGLRRNLGIPDIEKEDISPAFYTYTAVRCGILFNQTSNTAVNIVTADLTPTLQGNDPNIKVQGAFVTISCGTPFAVSAGVGFHTIEQKQFAIVQSSDGKGGTVNTFGVTSDSNITPVALALVHVRLAEWNRHKYSFYGSLGVGGSLQNQSSSSPVQFLPGVSVSFWRTMYITVGPDIGSKTDLAGGFKVGDIVPSGVSSVPTQTSHAVRFGFAISFTKP